IDSLVAIDAETQASFLGLLGGEGEGSPPTLDFNTEGGGAYIIEDSVLTFSSEDGTGLSVYDADGDVLTVTVTALNGTLSLPDEGESVSVYGNGTGNLMLVGYASDINSLIENNMTFTPNSNFQGTANINVSVDDGMGTGEA